MDPFRIAPPRHVAEDPDVEAFRKRVGQRSGLSTLLRKERVLFIVFGLFLLVPVLLLVALRVAAWIEPPNVETYRPDFGPGSR
jgi:hypothetical protein